MAECRFSFFYSFPFFVSYSALRSDSCNIFFLRSLGAIFKEHAIIRQSLGHHLSKREPNVSTKRSQNMFVCSSGKFATMRLMSDRVFFFKQHVVVYARVAIYLPVFGILVFVAQLNVNRKRNRKTEQEINILAQKTDKKQMYESNLSNVVTEIKDRSAKSVYRLYARYAKWEQEFQIQRK